MKKLNKKGFTLIELLAVIVILAVVLGIAIPAVSQYITKSKKNGYNDNLIQFIDAARKNATLGEKDGPKLPGDANTASIVSFEYLMDYLEKGGKKSSYDNSWEADTSYVVIVNDGTADSPKYSYYVSASDGSYAIGESGSRIVLEENALLAENVIRYTADDGGDVKYDSITGFNKNDSKLVPVTGADSATIKVTSAK